MKQIIGSIIVIVLIIVGFIYLKPDSSPQIEGKTLVSSSIFPWADFAKNIGGNKVVVNLILPPGAEPHGYSPTPKEIIKSQKSDLFLLNGGGLDTWAEKIVPSLNKKTKTLKMTEFVTLRKSIIKNEGDPHVWLDPVRARKLVEVIRNGLIEVDPENKPTYENNAEIFIRKLTELGRSYEQSLVTCKNRDVIVSHEAFGYLGERYNINFLGVVGLNPNDEPSAKEFGELEKLAQEKKIQFIYFEPLMTPKLAETLASDIGAEALVLNPLEGLTLHETEAGEDYISVMETNLRNLKLGMDC